MVEVIILGLGAITALSLAFSANTSTTRRLQLRAQLAGRYERTKVQAKSKLQDEALEKALDEAGLPFGPAVYNYIRIASTFLLLILALYKVIHGRSLIYISFPIFFVVGIDYRTPWMKKLFNLLNKQKRMRLNKDVFLLYKLITLELETYRKQKRTLYDMLNRIAPLTPRIRFAITHCLLLWQKSPEEGLFSLAKDIGTPEAKDLAQILLTVEESSSETAIELLKGKFTTFKRERVAWFRQRLYVYGLIAFGIATIGFGSVAVDILRVIALYTTGIMQQF